MYLWKTQLTSLRERHVLRIELGNTIIQKKLYTILDIEFF